MHRTLYTLSLLVAIGAINLEQMSHAQNIPAQANPGVIFNPAMESTSPQQASPARDLSEPSSQPTIEQKGAEIQNSTPAPASAEAPGEATIFHANTIEVQGNTILSQDQVRQIVSPYEGRDLNPEELSALISKLNEEYRKRGYMTSLAFIPPQDLERGTITVKVLEGTIGDMEVTGNKYFRAKVISNRISEKPGDKLNLPELEKELLTINRTEPYRIKAVLAPGEKTGETRIRLEVKEQQPFQIAATFDNAGRPYIGTYRTGIELLDRNVTGHGDRFSARYMIGAGQQIATTAYTLPVGRHGTEISALFGFSHVNLDNLPIQNQPEIIGNAYNYGLLLSQPLDKERVWVADLGLNARRASSFYDGDKTSTDDVRSATLGMNYNKYDRYGRTFARMQHSFAPRILGANSSFWKAEGFLTRVTRLPKNNLLLLTGYGQFAPKDLPPIEQFQLGGVNSVRGYTQGLLLGDRGYNLTAEWRWPVPFLRKASPWLADRVQGAFFYDYGQSWLDKDSRYLVAGFNQRSSSLMSAGFGARARLTDYLQGYIDVAFGLLDRKNVEPYNQPTARIHFGIRSELLSNDYKSRTDVVTPIKTEYARPRSVGMLRKAPLEEDIADPTLEPVTR